MNDMIYLFTGYASEYSLRPLEKYMREKGYHTIELDFSNNRDANEILNKLKGKDIVHITSWHFFLHKDYMVNYGYEQPDAQIYSPLEIMEYLRPKKSFFYPHDLGVFFHPIETKWLDLFDAVLLPYKNNEYYLASSFTDVIEVGWIYKRKLVKPRANVADIRILYMPSNLSYMLKHFDSYKETYQPLFDLGIDIKPFCYGGIERLVDVWRNEKNVNLLNMDLKLFDIIDDYDIIVSHNESSVTYESSLSGKATVALQDNADRAAIIPEFANLKKLGIKEAADYLAAIREGKEQYVTAADRLKPCDFETVLKILD